ncbi:SDR family NAD(P)-dependent oxidoreductase [Ruegeria marina]|uniref:Short-chain dehydrogenase n=1 Tax=Ruegeria marina TaxID=639004 RepID=A0A1G6N5D3_9RHOB|nr:SDR family NAD(P)-dependent oxidoreductase [Ruegeria marina]SDC63052.1 Short-chain dehydrogenase [Ruegeria marina]
MRDWSGKRYWLVGASEGLGAALAREMSAAGAHLVLSARRRAALDRLAACLPGPAEVLPVDIADDASVETAAQELGEIDGVVLLAGVYWPMRAQDWDSARAVTMADVNFTGYLRVLGAVVPGMVDRDRGHIVITGSLAGFGGLPGAVGYAASKAGVMALAECLHADLHRSGVEVQLVNPGFIRTRLTELNSFDMPMLMEPEEAARAMFRHMNGRRFATSFPAPFAWLFRVGRFLPHWLYTRFFA